MGKRQRQRQSHRLREKLPEHGKLPASALQRQHMKTVTKLTRRSKDSGGRSAVARQPKLRIERYLMSKDGYDEKALLVSSTLHAFIDNLPPQGRDAISWDIITSSDGDFDVGGLARVFGTLKQNILQPSETAPGEI